MRTGDDQFHIPEIGIRTSNLNEIQVCHDLEQAGWEVIKNGWPDFIAVKGRRLLLIEVKPRRNITGLSYRQRRVARIFRRFFDIEVIVMRPGDPIPRGFRAP